jgi:hypothetical protein
MRKVNLIDLVASLIQHDTLLQSDRRQMRKQTVKVGAGQRGKYFIVQWKTGF